MEFFQGERGLLMPSTLFTNWFQFSQKDIGAVSTLLAKPLSDNPAELQIQLSEAEGWHGRMTSLLAWANSFLDQAEKEALAARTDDMTDLDRKIELRATVAEERRVRDILDGVCEGIKNRLILGMSLLRAQNGERFGSRVLS